ncbi:MAG: glucosamine-6-phosphate deaminase [Clostridia bacterium]|nr:glucosamine-6-phosphate deaminase [Clostridia bacterium]
MKIYIKKDYEQLSEKAATIIAELVKEKPNCVLGLATGSTPIGTYKRLIQMHKNEGLDFSQVKTFNLDEYYGLGFDEEKSYSEDQSYARFMYEELFKHINVKPENTHIPNGKAKDCESFCREYEELIKNLGGIDLQVLGLGGDGHFAFNEPGSSLGSRTRKIALTEQTLDDNYEAFYKDAGFTREQMPHFAITMGIGTILESKNLLMLVNGEKKAKITAKALEGPITASVTASSIQLFSGKAYVILDELAASELERYDYYKHIEKMEEKYS